MWLSIVLGYRFVFLHLCSILCISFLIYCIFASLCWSFFDTMEKWKMGQWEVFDLVPSVFGHFDSSSGLRVPLMGWNALYTRKYSETLGDFGNCMSILFILPMPCHKSNNKEWVSFTCNNDDNSIASVRRWNVHAWSSVSSREERKCWIVYIDKVPAYPKSPTITKPMEKEDLQGRWPHQSSHHRSHL